MAVAVQGPSPALALSPLRRAATSHFIPQGETIILALRPDFTFVVLNRVRWLWLLLGLTIAMMAARELHLFPLRLREALSPLVVLVIVLAWRLLDWQTRLYLLTDRRILRVSGVLRQSVREIPLAKVQSVAVFKSLRERIFALGTLGVSSAGSDGIEVSWVMIAQPDETLRVVREAIDRYAPRPKNGAGVESGGVSP